MGRFCWERCWSVSGSSGSDRMWWPVCERYVTWTCCACVAFCFSKQSESRRSSNCNIGQILSLLHSINATLSRIDFATILTSLSWKNPASTWNRSDETGFQAWIHKNAYTEMYTYHIIFRSVEWLWNIHNRTKLRIKKKITLLPA